MECPGVSTFLMVPRAVSTFWTGYPWECLHHGWDATGSVMSSMGYPWKCLRFDEIPRGVSRSWMGCRWECICPPWDTQGSVYVSTGCPWECLRHELDTLRNVCL
ncbi:hypothetical protein BaRGS_00031306 [Batillaria attramentaria]|uniref:Uncharacterized protein n=1 Tax=Batillaria attramentaria TaxID=370345 RepID=A0ABD0JSD4_9CAEN